MNRNYPRIAFAAIAMLVAAYSLPAPAEARQGVMGAAAAEAAKASPDLMKEITKETGATAEQAAGAAGSLFGLAKSRLKADEFSQIAKAVPGMDLLLKAAPTASAAAGSSTDQLAQLAGSAAGGIPAVTSAFQKIGLPAAAVPKVASALTSFVTKSGGKNLGTLLAGALK